MWPWKPKICAIVDAYSSGNLLARAFRKRGFRSVHIQSSPGILPIDRHSYRPQDFIGTIVHKGDLGRTLEEIRAYHPSILIPGAEGGVEFADRLSQELGMATNGTSLSAARRDKYLMTRAVQSHGLRSAPSFSSADLGKILAWIEKNSGYPVVVKPQKSAGTDHVTLCRSQEEVKEAFDGLIGKQDRLGHINHEVLVQFFLKGDEYIVNTVSTGGRHFVTDIWRSRKARANGRDFVYDNVELLDPEGTAHPDLEKYVFGVLDALGIKHGPAHSEVMVTSEGPVLLEVGARLCGGNVHQLSAECLGVDQVTATCDAYIDPEKLIRTGQTPRRLRKHARIVSLISNEEGGVSSIPGLEKVRRLKSFHGSYMALKANEELEKTVDIFTCPGDIALVHEDAQVVIDDYRRIRDLEKSGFYEFKSALSRTAGS
jgi:biotin carboxylase